LDVELLYKEKKVVNHQFPMVATLNDPPSIYEGFIRCEKGEVKKLAEEKIWPFTEYVNWHKFRLELPNEYPVKPPIATWLTEISHPNIVPNIPGAVCVSILGENWKPSLRLVSIINALYYLLSDPNPTNVFDHPNCLKAAEACRKYGFPKMGEKKIKETVFNVIPIPETCLTRASKQDEILRFRIVE
jgi:hypothetical protein